MINQLILFDRIQNKDLQPWLPENNPDNKFTPLLSTIRSDSNKVQPQYSIEFYRPFNSKTKYYQKLLIEKVKECCTNIINSINEAEDIRSKKYLLNDILEKNLKSRLTTIGILIKERQLVLSLINPDNTSFDTDTDHKVDTYIIHLLKTCYIAIYLEIQFSFKNLLDDILIKEDFFTQLICEPVPTDTFIVETPLSVEVKSKSKKPQLDTPKPRDVAIYSFTYNELSTHSESLKDLHDNLILNKFISNKTTLPNFKRVFSNKEITSPIVWTGNISDLHYFIALIHNINKSVVNLKQHQWEIACKCFVQSDGTPFERKKLKGQKIPKLTSSLLERAAKFL